MDISVAYAPKLLPSGEPFLPEERSCPGCGQALAVRLIGKAIGHHNRFPYGAAVPAASISSMPQFTWRIFPPRRVSKKRMTSPENIRIIATDAGVMPDMMPLLQAARRRGSPLVVVCCFNEAGIQRHPSHLKTQQPDVILPWEKRIASIQAILQTVQDMHLAFMATATAAHPFDLITKVGTALEMRTAAFLGILTACPTGCRYPAAHARQALHRAVNSGYFPLFTAVNGIVTMQSLTQKRIPVDAYIRMHHAFLYAEHDEIAALQRRIDEYLDRLTQRTAKTTMQPRQ
ncbi:MAG: hypothetical protein N3B18_04630 [Desulfobacterota bacterium]|nr:hypothetical protein [Thermodesulfobacteriota bacterium]